MKKNLISLLAGIYYLLASSTATFSQMLEVQHFLDSLEKSFQWKTGQVTLGENLASMQVPIGWRYLPTDQADYVLTKLWGNPPTETLGMLFPENIGPLDSATISFNLSFDEIGFVKDDDADDFDYKEILENMQKEAVEANPTRVEQGYPSMEIVGWAATPFYDKAKKTLHWAKELKFGGEEGMPNTLNYDARLLGRKGVLSMNAIGTINDLERVKTHMPTILASAAFTEGNRYEDFDSSIDKVAAWTIGGLVAGKVLAKTGILALLLKFIKPLLLLLIAGGGAIWRFITGRKNEEEEVQEEPQASQMDTPEEGSDSSKS